MTWIRLIAAGLMLLSSVAKAQTTPILQYDAAGNPAVGSSIVLPESPAMMICQTNVTGGIDCLPATAPVRFLVDGQSSPLAETSDTMQIDYGLELTQPSTRLANVGIDSAYRPEYTDHELSSMGAVTATLPTTLGSTYTEGAGFVLKTVGGSARSLGRSYSFDCKAVSLNGSKYYCAYVGDADATTVQADAETRAAQKCTVIEAIAVTVLTNATPPVSSTIPSSCTLNVGTSTQGTDTGTLGSIAATTSGNTFTPASLAGWNKAERRAVWVQSSGGGCSGSRTLWVEVGCY